MEASTSIGIDFIRASTPEMLRRDFLVLQSEIGKQLKVVNVLKDGDDYVLFFYNHLDGLLLSEAFRQAKG